MASSKSMRCCLGLGLGLGFGFGFAGAHVLGRGAIGEADNVVGSLDVFSEETS